MSENEWVQQRENLINRRQDECDDRQLPKILKVPVKSGHRSRVVALRTTFIVGYPGETEADRIETFRIMSDIARQHSNVGFSPNIFTPYPGIPIWPQLKQMGVLEPQSLEEWIDMPLGKNVLPWLQGDELRRLRRMPLLQESQSG